jgi:hypothetical protein
MTRKVLGSIIALMAALALFAGASWQAWRVALKQFPRCPCQAAVLSDVLSDRGVQGEGGASRYRAARGRTRGRHASVPL